MSQPIIFLDDGGVMNDNSQRAVQWRLLVGEFFVPLLGGTSEAWMEANRVVADSMFDVGNWRRRIEAAADYASFAYSYRVDWMKGMCEFVGVPTLPEEESIELSCRAEAYILPRVRAAFAGVVETIRMLRNEGYILHTASGEPSSDLAGYLDAMGVRDCFGRLYGPDLIDTFKEGPEYYERIFAELGIASTDALVVDDSPRAISWAEQVGARTVLVSKVPQAEKRAAFQIGSLAELPGVIQRL